jgi:hypothetical protein
MPRLNQIVAVEKGVKSSAYKRVTELHKAVQKTTLLDGRSRTYRPKDDDGDQVPPENQHVQVRASDVLKDLRASLSELFDTVATKDWGNCEARADVKVDDRVIMPDVPVTYLLFLEKQLSDLKTFIEKLPVLDPSERWSYDEATDAYATEPSDTTRTKKIPRNHVKAEATKEHPAQVEVYMEDVVIGYWRTIRYSGALPQSRVSELAERVERLQKAVKFAREEANALEVTRKHVAEAFFDYLLE